ncbi:kinase-like protein [Pluteus cervinus]|uniref:Kinase-like protein n=1 Tax=Pluteus cervinus TaxID=181527 RepID=A0ACD3AWK0_9AGAR|nr:kinase-like protein [Pluteus cervinus]
MPTTSRQEVSATKCAPPILPFDPPGEVPTVDHLEAHKDHGRPMLNNYTRHAKVGGGQHGEVYLCHRVNGKLPHGHPERRIPVAMKSVKRDNHRAQQFKKLKQHRLPTSADHTPMADRLNTTEAKIRKEIAIMKKCRHPHVVRLYEVIDDRMKDKIYMVMEYLGGGEVKWRNDQHQPILTVEQTRRIMRDAILGLEYLHYQGIIHRDIKPANLLWTEDRRQVKIGDFGVSHFSYAQRLAAAGEDGSREDPTDPILLDDSDLTRRAGTPSFLAPEVVFEHFGDTPDMPMAGSSHSAANSTSSHLHTLQHIPPPSSSQSQSTTRPPLTKAIDIWALGVTLYCLLFGKTPFVADSTVPGSEWSLYQAICNQDWNPDDLMGFDQVPTGGRHPDGHSDGALVMQLLDHLLEKDATKRIVLSEVKTSPWFLRDLPDPQKWLKVTSPTKIDVSAEETSEAMSTVRFRWNWGHKITRRISSLLKIKPPRSRDMSSASGRVISAPQMGNGQGTTMNGGGATSAPQTASQPNPGLAGKNKSKGRVRTTSQQSTYGQTSSITTFGANSTSTFTQSRPSSKQSRNMSTDKFSPPSRGSESISIADTSSMLRSSSGVGVSSFGTSSMTHSTTTAIAGPSSTTSLHSPTDRDKEKPKTRFNLFGWKSTKSSSSSSSAHEKSHPSLHVQTNGPPNGILNYPSSVGTSSQGPASAVSSASNSTRYGGSGSSTRYSRRSDEPIRHYRSAQDTTTTLGQHQISPYAQHRSQNPHHQNYAPSHLMTGGLSAARRASSWGQGDQSMQSAADVVSVQSAHELDEHTMNVGAGGISNERAYVVRNSSRLTASPLTPGSPNPGYDPYTGLPISSSPPGGMHMNGYGDEHDPYGTVRGRPFIGDENGSIAGGTVSSTMTGDEASMSESTSGRFGPACYDETSTIASAASAASVTESATESTPESGTGTWQRGSDLFASSEDFDGGDGEGRSGIGSTSGRDGRSQRSQRSQQSQRSRQRPIDIPDVEVEADEEDEEYELGAARHMSASALAPLNPVDRRTHKSSPELRRRRSTGSRSDSGRSTPGEESDGDGVVFSTSNSRRRMAEASASASPR